MSQKLHNLLLRDSAELRMGETIIASDCTGEGLPIFSAEVGNHPWHYSNHCQMKFPRGSLVVGARGTIGNPRLPDFDEFTATQTTIVISPDISKWNPEYLLYALTNVQFENITAQQAVPMLTIKELGKVCVPCPTLSQQQYIAEILSTIDESIRQVENQNAKIQQIKMSLIHDLLTGRILVTADTISETKFFGGNSNYHLRPSYEVPQNLPNGWVARQLGQIIQVVQGGSLGLTKEKDYVSSGVPAYSAAGQDGFVEHVEFHDRPGVVLSAIGANCGRCFYAEDNWATLANVQALLPSQELDARFLYYRANVENYWERSGSAQPFIKPSSIKKAWIAYPTSPLVQKRIADILTAVDETIEENEALLTKLQQVKAGLMQDLLTGRVRVPAVPSPSDTAEAPADV